MSSSNHYGLFHASVVIHCFGKYLIFKLICDVDHVTRTYGLMFNLLSYQHSKIILENMIIISVSDCGVVEAQYSRQFMLVDLSVKLFFHGIETLRNIETMFFFK